MTHATKWLEELRHEGVHATATHLLVYATARALSANGKLHQIVAGNRRHYPADVDIGLSITGDSFIAPVLVIERAQEKSVAEIVTEIAARAPEVAAGRRSRCNDSCGVGDGSSHLVSCGARSCGRSSRARRSGGKASGRFRFRQCLRIGRMSSAFSTAGVLIAGQTRSRVVAVDGRPEVRPMMTLTLCGDHGVWDGRASVRVLAAVKSELEGHGSQTKRDERREASRP